MHIPVLGRCTSFVIRFVCFASAGVLGAVLCGCSGSSVRIALAPNDTGWETPSTYASATASIPPRNALRSGHLHLCSGAPCGTPRAEVRRQRRGM